jgi:hypothetical protein
VDGESGGVTNCGDVVVVLVVGGCACAGRGADCAEMFAPMFDVVLFVNPPPSKIAPNLDVAAPTTDPARDAPSPPPI